MARRAVQVEEVGLAASTASTNGVTDPMADTGGRVMNEKAKTEAAEYFGLKVEVICLMEHCALVRFGDREFVVDAADLVFVRMLRHVA